MQEEAAKKDIKKKKKKKSTYIPKPPKKKNYLNNKDMLKEHALSVEQDQMTDTFTNMMMILVKRYSTRANFSGYSYKEDMEGTALLQVCMVWKQFNAEKSNNPFAFFTQVIKNSFLQVLNKEKRVRTYRDVELTYAGAEGSQHFQDNFKWTPGERLSVSKQKNK